MHGPPAANTDMAVLPSVLGARTLRRTETYASGPSPAVPRDGCPVARASPRSRDGVSCIMRASALGTVLRLAFRVILTAKWGQTSTIDYDPKSLRLRIYPF